MASAFLTRWHFVLVQNMTTRIKDHLKDPGYLNRFESSHQMKQMLACVSFTVQSEGRVLILSMNSLHYAYIMFELALKSQITLPIRY